MTTQVTEMIPEASRDAAAPRDRADVTALVVSADPEIRDGWARWIERDGGMALRCAGPAGGCALLAGMRRCPLHLEADIAYYDMDAISGALLARLLEWQPRMGVAFAVDDRGPDGHRPRVRYLIAGGAVRKAALPHEDAGTPDGRAKG